MDRLVGFAFTAVGAGMLLLVPTAVRNPTVSFPGMDSVLIRPDFYPRVIGALIVVAGLWIVASDLLRSRRQSQSARVSEMLESVTLTWRGAAFFASTFLYAMANVYLGFRTASVIFFLAWGLAMEAGWRRSLLMAVPMMLIIHLVFTWALNVPLLTGPFGL